MKVGNLEIPDKKLLIFGFPEFSQKEIEKLSQELRQAKDGSYILSNFYFEKVNENDTTIIINGYKRKK